MGIHLCQWLLPKQPDSDKRETCNLVAVSEVTVKTKITQAKVWVCHDHLREHNYNFYAARTTSKS